MQFSDSIRVQWMMVNEETTSKNKLPWNAHHSLKEHLYQTPTLRLQNQCRQGGREIVENLNKTMSSGHNETATQEPTEAVDACITSTWRFMSPHPWLRSYGWVMASRKEEQFLCRYGSWYVSLTPGDELMPRSI